MKKASLIIACFSLLVLIPACKPKKKVEPKEPRIKEMKAPKVKEPKAKAPKAKKGPVTATIIEEEVEEMY